MCNTFWMEQLNDCVHFMKFRMNKNPSSINLRERIVTALEKLTTVSWKLRNKFLSFILYVTYVIFNMDPLFDILLIWTLHKTTWHFQKTANKLRIFCIDRIGDSSTGAEVHYLRFTILELKKIEIQLRLV